EDTEIEGEIAGLGDFAFNLGYIFGPISAGFLADWLGMNISFTLVGVLGVIISLVLLTWSPKHINIEVSPAEWR
ncbi:MAG: hypothetical protein NTY66_03300, partial [Candidatus Vogelbacteria bacterium]|nr:hypothetical protein [Candidatus Vogelbacteria bacterium]